MYYHRHIEPVIEDGEMLHPIEIKTSGDPTKSMVKAFSLLNGIPGKKTGDGALICLAKERLPLKDKVWILPAQKI